MFSIKHSLKWHQYQFKYLTNCHSFHYFRKNTVEIVPWGWRQYVPAKHKSHLQIRKPQHASYRLERLSCVHLPNSFHLSPVLQTWLSQSRNTARKYGTACRWQMACALSSVTLYDGISATSWVQHKHNNRKSALTVNLIILLGNPVKTCAYSHKDKQKITSFMWDLRFPQWYSWGFTSSGAWRSATGSHSALIFRVRQSMNSSTLKMMKLCSFKVSVII